MQDFKHVDWIIINTWRVILTIHAVLKNNLLLYHHSIVSFVHLFKRWLSMPPVTLYSVSTTSRTDLQQAHRCDPAGSGLFVIGTEQLQVSCRAALCGLEKRSSRESTGVLIPKTLSKCPNKWRHLDAEAVVWRCAVRFFVRQDRVDITVTEAGKELQMSWFLQGSTNEKHQFT